MGKGKIVAQKGFNTEINQLYILQLKEALGQSTLETRGFVVSVLQDTFVVTHYQLCLIKAFPLKIFHFEVVSFQKMCVSCKFMVTVIIKTNRIKITLRNRYVLKCEDRLDNV